MITIRDNHFILSTKNTSYLFYVNQEGLLEHMHYGGRCGDMEVTDAVRALQEKVSHSKGTTINYRKNSLTCLEDMPLEISSMGKGDFREPFIKLTFTDGSRTCDFLYESSEILETFAYTTGMPCAFSNDRDQDVMQLRVHLKEAEKKVTLDLYYTVFESKDIITRRAVLNNDGEEQVQIDRIMSNQVDFDNNHYKMVTFNGNWAREMYKHETCVPAGLYVNHTTTGVSSNRANPFVMLADVDANETSGEVYGFNLIYSGNHYEAAQVSGFGKTRFLSGLDDTDFNWTLAKGEAFETPEAVMTYSNSGYRGVSLHMHPFIRENIVRSKYKDQPRPILLNSWEASYFDINESKLVNLARKAKDAGVELFVMDDGWFKGRNNDTSSLGDWNVDLKKLPGGVKRLSEKIHAMGLMFGIWVEPEMINEDSDLFRAHPEYAMKAPGRDNSLGRNQMILDLTNPEVVEYVKNAMRDVFSSAAIEYVKWDMNRMFSDVYSAVLEPSKQKETSHRYVLGLYDIMKTLTEEFPNILFEGCASGGNRFDLGILAYMPQIWASDDTDAMERTTMQTGYSYGYPMSTVTAHVSACPNHQTLRVTPLYTRFNIASFGVLGYELNLCELPSAENDEIKAQVELYKQWRDVLCYGDFYRINDHQWMSVSKDKTRAVSVMWKVMAEPNTFYDKLSAAGLDPDMNYHVCNVPMKHNIKQFGDLVNTIAPIHIKKDSLLHNTLAKFVKMDGETENYIINGELLNNSGIKLSQAFGGTGYNSETRLYQDYASRIYFFEAVTVDEDGEN